jgi:UDP-N-acetylmuramoyl-tripeptide--D-alanyl-D-alanine ligase
MKYISLNDFRDLPDCFMIDPPSDVELQKTLRGISIDSRSLKAGQVFWALRGPKFDGHDFVTAAMRQGAVAAVINKTNVGYLSGRGFPLVVVRDSLKALQDLATLHRKKFSIPVIAITGTNGKTTTKEMIAWILQKRMNVHHTEGNLNNHIGLPLTLLELNSMHDISIVELGTNHPGEIELLGAITKPSGALITNIGMGHLEYFSSVEGVAREKLVLFKKVQKNGTHYINLDDKRLASYTVQDKNIVYYSLDGNKKANVKGNLLDVNDIGAGVWRLNDMVTISMKIAGIHNVRNGLAAASIAIGLGFKEQEIKSALEGFTPYEKRMQIIKNDGITIINDTYNANPDSYIPALETLYHIAKKMNNRKIVVMGDMLELGEKSLSLHQDLCSILIKYKIDGIFTLGDTCTTAAQIFKAKGFDNIYSYNSHESLAKELKKFMKPNDIILLKGSRGMQMEKILAYL